MSKTFTINILDKPSDSLYHDPSDNILIPAENKRGRKRPDPNHFKSTGNLTSDRYEGLRNAVLDYATRVSERGRLIEEAKNTISDLVEKRSRFPFGRLFVKKHEIENERIRLLDLEHDGIYKPIATIEIEGKCFRHYNYMIEAFNNMSSSHYTWGITFDERVENEFSRSGDRFMDRFETRFTPCRFDCLDCSHAGFRAKNNHGGDLIIYPAFAIYTSGIVFHLIDLYEMEFKYKTTYFREDQYTPNDAEFSHYSKRSHGYGSDVYVYGEISIRTKQGMNERYLISNREAAKGFVELMNRFIILTTGRIIQNSAKGQ